MWALTRRKSNFLVYCQGRLNPANSDTETSSSFLMTRSIYYYFTFAEIRKWELYVHKEINSWLTDKVFRLSQNGTLYVLRGDML